MNNLKDLIKICSELFPDRDSSRMIVEFAGLPLGNIDFAGSARNMWYKILTEAKKHNGGLLKIVKMAQSEYPDNADLNNAIRTETNVAIRSTESISKRSGKEISTPLNIDTEALEKIMGSRNDLVEIEWLSKALTASNSVCKVALADGHVGTGWIFKNKYLITNNHVIETVNDAATAKIIFNYQLSGGDSIKEFRLDPHSEFYSSPSNQLDYVCIPIIDDGTLSNYGSLDIDISDNYKIEDLVNIIQHPMGGVKKIAMPDEILSIWTQKHHLFYMADTLGGSSGSPVFNQNWKVIALHHAGKDERDGGFVINANGVKKPANRGIFISAIISDMKQKGMNT